MSITPMPDQEAANFLGVHYMTIRRAVERGDLTRVPRAGRIQHVAREQVELFQGKKILKGNLDTKKRAIWEEIDAAIQRKQEINSQTISTSEPTLQATSDIEHLMREMARQEYERIREEERIAANNAQLRAEQRERFLKDHPFLRERELAAV